MIYVLKLKHEKWYVGYTERANGERLKEHFKGDGAKWTKIYKPLVCVGWDQGTLQDEDELTLQMMEKYQWTNVRGGRWCKIEMKKPPKRLLSRILSKAASAQLMCERFVCKNIVIAIDRVTGKTSARATKNAIGHGHVIKHQHADLLESTPKLLSILRTHKCDVIHETKQPQNINITLDDLPVADTKKQEYFSNLRALLTYKCVMDIEEYAQWVTALSIYKGRELKEIVFCFADSGTHVLLIWDKPFRSRSEFIFDYKDAHPIVRLIPNSRQLNKVRSYMNKVPDNNSTVPV